MKTYKYYIALIVAMAISTSVLFAQAPVRRTSSTSNSSTSRINASTPPKRNVPNKPAPLNGYHEITYSDGGVYKGNFKNDLFEGYGELKYAAGGVYKGYFKNGQCEGSGELTYADGGV